MNLYRVELTGLNYSTTGTALSPAYVVAQDAEAAYVAVKSWADAKGYGFDRERTLKSVTLLATTFDPQWSPKHPAPLFLEAK